MRNFFTVLLVAASALASPEPQITGSGESIRSETNPDADASASSAASALVAAIPSSILTVMETAIPASWQDSLYHNKDEILTDPSFRSSVASAASAGTYPAWYNELPSSVKAWASSNFDAQVLGVSTTSQSVASETGSNAVSTSASAVSNASQITSSSASSAATSVSGSTSVSSAKSTGGAPAPTSGAAMGVAGAAGVLALALAL
ncbi:hypothetical protein N7520_004354 [Penicillium odoratum]|uniref:uncharacterized protein n=1 Tax=Penicillium odoratum TaxID=1167516 RepID=UPI002547BBC1|nr:uncharacterized protein N7520_004354 [Penicillium odoratum]KAJ5764795.1 hypothetical protein N7520_004354 [Penicillium odoratum]